MQTTTNYGLKIYEGTDLFNPLTVENVNTSDLDTIVKGVSDAAVGTATELLTGTVHALTRADTDRDVFHFTATADYEAGETFEVDGVQVTAKTPDGQNLSTGAYVINSSVLCILDGTLLTVIVNPAKALDSDKLDGHDSAYFATAGDLTILDNQVGAISSKVGTGVLTTTAQDCIGAINEVNAELSNYVKFQSKSDSVTIAHGNYTSFDNLKPSISGYEWHLMQALPSTGAVQITGVDGYANRVMALTSTQSSSTISVITGWIGIKTN